MDWANYYSMHPFMLSHNKTVIVVKDEAEAKEGVEAQIEDGSIDYTYPVLIFLSDCLRILTPAR